MLRYALLATAATGAILLAALQLGQAQQSAHVPGVGIQPIPFPGPTIQIDHELLVAYDVSGGTLLGAIAVVAIAGGAGAALGATRAIVIKNVHAKHLEQHLRHGGLLLWVRTHDAAHEKKSLEILSHHSGEDVHLHTMKQQTNRLQSLPVRRPFLSFGPPQ